jgi:glyoxylase-like metal-dependent hydrolase (beta-lactamase superfamily II)
MMIPRILPSVSALTFAAVAAAIGMASFATASAEETGATQSSGLTPDLAQYGTDPGGRFLPEGAVDTDKVPNIILSADAPADKPLPHYKIAEDTYLFFGNIAITDTLNRGWNGNAGFVVTKEGVVVIDALGTPKLGQRLIATIRSVTDKPISHLIITHNHPDHSYGAVAFTALDSVRIIAHKGVLEYNHSALAEESATYRKDLLGDDMRGFRLVKPDTLVDVKRFERITVRSGERRFDIYNAGQHHSYGDLVIHQNPDNIVWISDLAFNQRTTFMGDGHSKQAIAAQTWLLESFNDAKLMVPGHGSAQTAPFKMVDETRNYMQSLRRHMGSAVDEGIGLYEAVKGADFPQWKDVRLYGLNHPSNANFVYREMEQELF